MTNNCTIISQIITLPHVSTLSCNRQDACNQYLAKLHKRTLDQATDYRIGNTKIVNVIYPWK